MRRESTDHPIKMNLKIENQNKNIATLSYSPLGDGGIRYLLTTKNISL